jgi:hypothetical protein
LTHGKKNKKLNELLLTVNIAALDKLSAALAKAPEAR